MPRRDATGAVRVVPFVFVGSRDVAPGRCSTGSTSAPFERLLLERARPIVADVEAGEAFLLAGLAVALDAPVLVVTPARGRPRSSRRRSAPTSGPSGSRCSGVGRAAVRGDGSGARGGGPRADAVGRLRPPPAPSSSSRPYLAAMQRMPPTLGDRRRAGARGRRGAGARRARRAAVDRGYARVDVVEHRASSRSAVGSSTSSPGSPGRPARLEYWGDEIERIREFSPSTQLSTAQLGVGRVAPVRELLADDAVRAVAEERARADARAVRDDLQRLADGLRFEGSDTLSPFLFDGCGRRPNSCRPARGWCVTQAQRTLRRAEQTHAEAEALAEAIEVAGAAGASLARRGRERRTRRAAPDRVRRRRRPRYRGAGGPPRATRPSSRPASRGPAAARGSCSPAAARARCSAPRGARGPAGRGGRGPARRRVPVRAGRARGRHRGGPVRVAAPHAHGAALRASPVGLGRRRARARRLRGPSDPRRRSLRRRGPPGARRRRARLPRPRVRGQRPALRPLGAGRHGGEVPRRGCAAPAPAGRVPTGRAPRRA